MLKLLVVEDNEMNMEVVTRFLKRQHYEIVTATDGKSGIETALREQPNLILMDLSLPEMDGFEAIRRLRKAPATASTPIIVLTAHATEQDIAKAVKAGCDHYETKPINLFRLMKKIDALLE